MLDPAEGPPSAPTTASQASRQPVTGQTADNANRDEPTPTISPPVVTFMPLIVEGDPNANDHLRELNEQISSEGVTVDVAKILIANRNVLNIPGALQQTAWTTLASHYGFEPSSSGFMSENDHHRDISAAVDLEKFDVDPSAAIIEYRKHHWAEELGPFSEQFVRENSVSFAAFADVAMAAVISKKAGELTAEAEAEKQRILDMTPEEWEEYRQGIRWSQSGRASDVFREKTYVVEEILKVTRHVDGLYFIKTEKWDDVLTLFSGLQIAQQLYEKSELRKLEYGDFTTAMLLGGRQLALHRGNVLIPKDTQSSK
ncbi:MAG: hypothetical protein ACD_37C00091G0006 [uncultured bacterium]|nr:MAG: hypothetical protein ACD_37C00091G0006 [uncultured bacterium]